MTIRQQAAQQATSHVCGQIHRLRKVTPRWPKPPAVQCPWGTKRQPVFGARPFFRGAATKKKQSWKKKQGATEPLRHFNKTDGRLVKPPVELEPIHRFHLGRSHRKNMNIFSSSDRFTLKPTGENKRNLKQMEVRTLSKNKQHNAWVKLYGDQIKGFPPNKDTPPELFWLLVMPASTCNHVVKLLTLPVHCVEFRVGSPRGGGN